MAAPFRRRANEAEGIAPRRPQAGVLRRERRAANDSRPRCGALRQPDPHYCLDCGLRLPAVTGRLATLRRRWIRRLGWYPGDWIWISLLTLVVAAAGAAAAIALTGSDAGA